MGFIELGLGQLAQKVALVLVGVYACQQAMGGLSIDFNGVFAAECPYTVRAEFEATARSNLPVAQHIRVRVRPAAYSSNM